MGGKHRPGSRAGGDRRSKRFKAMQMLRNNHKLGIAMIRYAEEQVRLQNGGQTTAVLFPPPTTAVASTSLQEGFNNIREDPPRDYFNCDSDSVKNGAYGDDSDNNGNESMAEEVNVKELGYWTRVLYSQVTHERNMVKMVRADGSRYFIPKIYKDFTPYVETPDPILCNSTGPVAFLKIKIFVFEPLGIPKFSQNPSCWKCASNVNVESKGWCTSLRKIQTLSGTEYFMYKRYLCKLCKVTFVPTDERVLKLFPDYVKDWIPYHFSHRSGISKDLLAMLPPLVDGGFGCKKISNLCKELKDLKYTRAFKSYNSMFSYVRRNGGVHFKPMRFFTKEEYFGGASCGEQYISKWFCSIMLETECHIDQMMTLVPVNILAGDMSHKVIKHMSIPGIEGLMTIMNGFGMIRYQALLPGKSLEYLEQGLRDIVKTTSRIKESPTTMYFTDNCCVKKSFLNKIFPNLTPENSDLPTDILKLPQETEIYYITTADTGMKQYNFSMWL